MAREAREVAREASKAAVEATRTAVEATKPAREAGKKSLLKVISISSFYYICISFPLDHFFKVQCPVFYKNSKMQPYIYVEVSCNLAKI